MRNERSFVCPLNLTEAVHRAHYTLTRLKYRTPELSSDMTFERSFPFSGMLVVHPHHVHAKVRVRLTELPDGTCRAELTQDIFKLGSPSSRLDKVVWKGDLDDVEGQLTRRETPKIDRMGQNAYAGKISIIYLSILIALSVGVGIGVGILTLSIFLALVSWSIVFLIGAYALPYLPLRMPEFWVENFVPDPPFDSNYVRTGYQR